MQPKPTCWSIDMPTKISRRLVIDASIARASGGKDAVNPTSKNCRDFLIAVLKICHQAVMTTEVYGEWKRHQSGFAYEWRVAMIARKKLQVEKVAQNSELRKRIESAAKNDRQVYEMLKDAHLIEAAIVTDKAIISLDELVRNLFSEATGNVKELRYILWVNPDKAEDQCIVWLEGGARVEKKRLLGSVVKL
jgi:hypothetical protein